MTTPSRPEILQFGTSRFLLAHVDAFVSQSLADGLSDKRVVVVQSSARAEGKAKAPQMREAAQEAVDQASQEQQRGPIGGEPSYGYRSKAGEG